MKKDEENKIETPKKLVLRRTSIRELDSVDLALVAGGADLALPPPPSGPPQI